MSVTAAEYASLLCKYGYDDVDIDKWYPCQDFLNFLTELVERPNAMFNFVAIGMSAAEVSPMPPHMADCSFEQVVEGWDEHYKASFRKGDIGYKTTVKPADKHYKVVHHQTLIPDDQEYGVLYGFAKRFLPSGTKFTVWYDKDVPRMDEGGEETVIHVQWN